MYYIILLLIIFQDIFCMRYLLRSNWLYYDNLSKP